MGEPFDPRRKRLLFRSWHRGMRETDLLLGHFADRYLGELDEDQLGRYEALLEAEDGNLLDWIMQRIAPPAEFESDVLRLLINFHHRPQ